MDIRQLRYFLEVARLSNFTKAAESLRIAQPAVSMAVKKLEEELDLVLFNRQDKKVSLTAEGEIFQGHARRILDDLRGAELEMAELKGLTRGEVRIGITPMISAYFFPDIFRDFKRSYPQLSISVLGEGSGRIQKMIGEGELDMGVVAGGGSAAFPPTLEVRRFLREEIVVCVPPDHPFAGRQAVTLTEFIGEPLVFYKEGYYIREFFLEALKGTGSAPRIIFETNLFSLVKSLVRNGTGISIFLKMVVAEDTDLAAVSFDPPLHLDLLIAWKKDTYLSLANRAFVDFLLEHAPGERDGDPG
ncbi:LysR family transcriptional regulator [Geomonas anaerohicana]|uniref:LysR family transcriptional regulator n=1 Tax=Geomonas anaerohicana TaxID=2798583 RepID=A0ABS0YHB1_9BACT|nr:LysR family transcriptional regulator [Geomonas anaerohicana]MBJ6751656.1 LysR family transcriptional regulator [Geomonas anaerohicana]